MTTTLSLLPEDLLLLIVHFTDVDSALSLIQVCIPLRNPHRGRLFHLRFVDLQDPARTSTHQGILAGGCTANAPHAAGADPGPRRRAAGRPAQGDPARARAPAQVPQRRGERGRERPARAMAHAGRPPPAGHRDAPGLRRRVGDAPARWAAYVPALRGRDVHPGCVFWRRGRPDRLLRRHLFPPTWRPQRPGRPRCPIHGRKPAFVRSVLINAVFSC
jgi:hypothetical protein